MVQRELYRPVPPLAWAPLVITVFGIDNLGKVFLLFMVSFSTTGIGFVENAARKYMQYEVIWITIFVMGMLGLLFDKTLRKIIAKTIPWFGKG